ncbi:MAG: hypothetical protein WAK33_04165 [Silvibacterium sp.]
MTMRAPAFQFYPRQFAGDDVVVAMDLDAIGAHILLMCVAAASPEYYRIRAGDRPDGCGNPAGERAIRNILRNPTEEDWQRIKSQLLSGAWKPSEDGRWWVQDGLKRTFEKQKAFSEAQRDRANKRYQNHANGMQGQLPGNYRDSAEPVPENCSSSTSASSEKDLSSKAGLSDDSELSAVFQKVWLYYIEKTERNQKLYAFTPKRKGNGLARLRECLKKTEGDLERATKLMMLAVDGLCASEWHMGADQKSAGKRYVDWVDHLFGNYERMEKWWNAC